MNKRLPSDDVYLQPSNENIYTDLETNETRTLEKYESISICDARSDPNPAYLTPVETVEYSELGQAKQQRGSGNDDDKQKTFCNLQQKRFWIVSGIIIIICICSLTAGVTYAASRQFASRNTCNQDNCGAGECRLNDNGQSVCVISGNINSNENFRVSVVTGECPSSWLIHDNRCYKEFLQMRTWFQSRDYCRSIGADLVTIQQQSKMDFIDSQYPNVLHWVGLRRLNSTFIWVDGTNIDFTYWAANEPNNHNNVENCVHTNRESPRGWHDSNCYLSQRFICEMSFEPACGNGDWHYYNGSCYLFERDLRLDWIGSSEYCYSLDPGADLLTINSLDEHNFIVSEASKSTNPPLWIGLSTMYSDNLDWPDFSGLSISMWAEGEPTVGSDDCVRMYTYGFWFVVNCNNASGFICEKKIF